MLIEKFFPLRSTDDDAGGGYVDRGDELEPTPPKEELDAAEEKARAAEEALKKELDSADEDDVDPEDPDAEEKAEKKPRKDTRIPLSRHKEILEKEREARAQLERELAKYHKGSELADINEQITAAEDSILKMEKEYAQLLTDGEIDKATALMAQIRKTERSMAEARSDMKIQAAEARNTERARYNITLERIESAFPTLNPDHEDFDEDVMAEVVDLKEAYQMKGMTPTQALQKAVKMLVEPRTTRQEIATSAAPRVSEKDIAAERKAAAVKKATEAAEKTPPTLTRVGKDGDKLGGGKYDAEQIMKMSQKEFAALSEEDLAKMRGDDL